MRRTILLVLGLLLVVSCASRRTPAPSPVGTATQPPTTLHAELAAADEALRRGDLDRAHEIYAQLLHRPDLPRDVLLGVARGLYQTADFAGAVTAFSRIGVLRPGEEHYHYYAAVALFETGNFDAARIQIICALPYVERTDEVERYLAKIEAIHY